MQAETIDEVIAYLEDIIQTSRERNSRLGYFPALYKRVTIAVKEAIANGEFHNGPRMEKLDVIFANRYLAAYTEFMTGAEASTSWMIAFNATQRWRPIVLQHLFLGMNAHINLDLGVAAATVSPGNDLQSLEHDFNKINVILSSLINEVQDELAQIWPPMKWIDRFFGKTDEWLASFSMEKAREQAWKVAQSLAFLTGDEREKKIAEIDAEVAVFGDFIAHPGIILSLVALIIRLKEPRSVVKIIDILNRTTP